MKRKLTSIACCIIVALVHYAPLGGQERDMTKKKSLTTYRARRNLKKSGEPAGNTKKKSTKKPIFVIQKHDASHLHYDFRLEIDGVLVSWAVPKGPSLNPRDKRLAVPTDDHPMDYASFEGTIPEGNYGAGPVIVWDTGTYENSKEEDGKEIPMETCLQQGRIEIVLRGTKLQGGYALIKTKNNQWLLIKMRDEYASARKNPVKSQPESVLSGQTIAGLAQDDKKKNTPKKRTVKKKSKKTKKQVTFPEIVVTHPEKVMFGSSGITKQEMVDYYTKIAPTMLPYLHGRLITMQRFPQGITSEGFFQKDASDYFPSWIERYPVKKKDGGTVHYVIINSVESLIYLANQLCITFHGWLSTSDALHYPDRMIFDLDPSGTDFNQVRRAGLELKKLLEELGLTSFVMATGSRGLHVIVPLKQRDEFDAVRDFAYTVAQLLVKRNPDLCTLELRKAERHQLIFVDYLRNSFSATSVVPYSIRPKPNAPVAAPLQWSEVKKKSLKPDMYTVKTIFKRLARIGDPLKDFTKHASSLTKARRVLDALIKGEQE